MNLRPLALLLLALLFVPSARAAESYDSCTGYIASLPATISTQGTWCFNKDLSTGLTFADAINIATNNVTIDCNGFKLGGLAAGPGTLSNGIAASDRFNITVRNCNIRGFARGVFLQGTGLGTSGGHIVEDNRFQANTWYGVTVDGDGSVVRRNLVLDTGLSTAQTDAVGISGYWGTEVLDNTIVGVTARAGSNGTVHGIYLVGSAGSPVAGNRIRKLTPDGYGTARGILLAYSGNAVALGNVIAGNGGTYGVLCTPSAGSAAAKDNVISSFTTPLSMCTDAGGNAVLP